MKDFCLELDESPENLALIGESLGAAGVNIEGLCLTLCYGRQIIHLLVKDAMTARRALEDSGMRIKAISEVFVLDKEKKRVTRKPGSFGGICRKLADNGIKIKFGYPAENNRYVFGVDDVAKTQELLE
ncbi:amino acid-binding protein [candidate division KSB1 bacterium]|nr:amino acid-binding protein [candidate division KSB1 bacterium]